MWPGRVVQPVITHVSRGRQRGGRDGRGGRGRTGCLVDEELRDAPDAAGPARPEVGEADVAPVVRRESHDDAAAVVELRVTIPPAETGQKLRVTRRQIPPL